MTDRQDENAEIARRFLQGFSFAELAEDYPERDVEQAFREHARLQEAVLASRSTTTALDALLLLLKALSKRPSACPPGARWDRWSQEHDEWMRDELDPAVDRALEIIRESDEPGEPTPG
jgi:hypothetical protein